MYVRWERVPLAPLLADDQVNQSMFGPWALVRQQDGTVKRKWARLVERDDGRRMNITNIGLGGDYLPGTVERNAFHAKLVESRRINGKPRQRILAYLGSYQDGDVELPEARARFWREVDRRLAGLDLSDDDRDKITAALASRMPRPVPGEV